MPGSPTPPGLWRPKKRRQTTVLHYIEFGMWTLASGLLSLMRRRRAVWLADALGAFIYHVLRVRRREVEGNLRLALKGSKSKSEVRALARRVYQNFVLTFFEFLQPSLLRNGSDNVVSLAPGAAGLFQPLISHPSVVVTAHMGNWEVMPECAHAFGVKLLVLAKHMHNPLVDREINRRRASESMEILHVRGESLKTIVRAARHGKWLVFVADQDARRHGIFVDFLGRPASTAIGPALFAWRLGAPILPAFCVRDNSPDRKLTIRCFPPIYPQPGNPKDEEIRRLTEAHVRLLEKVIEQHPESYFWMHRRWKTQPKRRSV